METVEEFRGRARRWLEQNAPRRAPMGADAAWGLGSDSLALISSETFEEETEHIEALRAWIRRKADAGFDCVSWEPEWGGKGWPRSYERAFNEEESQFVVPARHAAIAVTRNLVAPTIRAVGTPAQRRRYLRRMLRTDDIWCQLFSEPGAGSDLASIATRAERAGDGWIINGQKVWTSGARHADFGYIQCRTDPSVPKHQGLTAFVLPMSSEGIEVRPLRQLTGGSSFNEVFLTDVRVLDSDRLGEMGEGWRVALTTLGFEREASTADDDRPLRMLLALARHLDRAGDPVIRQALATAYTRQRVQELTNQRVKAVLGAGETPGPEGSIGKLLWTETLRALNDAASALLGPRLVADSGDWGTFSWSEHVLGTAGFRVAGGTDEIQRNVIGERALGLPPEPRADRGMPFSELPRGWGDPARG